MKKWMVLLVVFVFILASCAPSPALATQEVIPDQMQAQEMVKPTDMPAEIAPKATVESAPETTEQEEAPSVLDFEITFYQGEETLASDKEVVVLTDLFNQDKPVLVNFWAGLCPKCRAELPELERLYQKYQDQVTFVAIDIGPYLNLGSDEDAKAMLQDLQITIPAGSPSRVAVMREYNILGTPWFLLFHPNGKLFANIGGAIPEAELAKQIDELLLAAP
jgi:thiol-disulfide isomerase/thioredoxin